jgi:hypothetical protein
MFSIMDNPTPEELAKDFARRWLSHESQAVREIGERELLKIIRQAAGQPEPSNDQSRAA